MLTTTEIVFPNEIGVPCNPIVMSPDYDSSREGEGQIYEMLKEELKNLQISRCNLAGWAMIFLDLFYKYSLRFFT